MQGTVSKLINKKKIAIVHDAIVEYGGGERVLDVLAQTFPRADIYTSSINYEKTKNRLPKGIEPTFIQALPIFRQWPRLIQLFSPSIWFSINLDTYDIVISHGGFYLSHLINLRSNNKKYFHFHYFITPPKNLYLPEHRRWFEAPLNIILYPFLRRLDKKAIAKINILFTVSDDVKKRVSRIYKKEAMVLYPPVSVPPRPTIVKRANREYYCYIGRLEKDKCVDLLIEAFNKSKLPLVIVGRGKDEERLRSMAEKNVKFLGFKEGKEIGGILSSTKAFMHAAIDDDFPLAPVEAMAHGVPVIAYYSGGIKESVLEEKTGLFFRVHSKESLINAIKRFESMHFDPRDCYKQAKKFSEDRFKKEIVEKVAMIYEKSLRH